MANALEMLAKDAMSCCDHNFIAFSLHVKPVLRSMNTKTIVYWLYIYVVCIIKFFSHKRRILRYQQFPETIIAILETQPRFQKIIFLSLTT